MKKKFYAVLIAIIGDSSFKEHIEKEYHAFMQIIEDFYSDSESNETLADDIVEQFKDFNGDLIKAVYNELTMFY